MYNRLAVNLAPFLSLHFRFTLHTKSSTIWRTVKSSRTILKENLMRKVLIMF